MSINADDLSIARRPASVIEELTIFMTKVELEVMLKKGKEKASASSTSLNLTPPYPEVAAKPYPQSIKCLSSKISMAVQVEPESMLCASLNLRIPLLVILIYLREFTKFLIDQSYTWYVNLKSGTSTLYRYSFPSSSFMRISSPSLSLIRCTNVQGRS